MAVAKKEVVKKEDVSKVKYRYEFKSWQEYNSYKGNKS